MNEKCAPHKKPAIHTNAESIEWQLVRLLGVEESETAVCRGSCKAVHTKNQSRVKNENATNGFSSSHLTSSSIRRIPYKHTHTHSLSALVSVSFALSSYRLIGKNCYVFFPLYFRIPCEFSFGMLSLYHVSFR